MPCGFHFKARVLLLAYKQQTVQCEGRVAYIERRCQKLFCTYTAFIRNIPQNELLHVFFKQIKHVHASVQACGWPFQTFVVTRVNMRYVFYYNLSEYANSP